MAKTDGFMLLDKPEGWTSHDVVSHVRSVTGALKVGHSGTLDPPATGLLVLGVGRCTRLLRFVQELPKSYAARVSFGVATDTLDASGAVLSREPMPISRRELDEVLSRFVGVIPQVPPMVSALRVDGRRLYELARRGEEVDRRPRRVEVHEIAVDDFSPGDYPEATLQVRCGKGTYIRSLADDIAQALGGRAHLLSLRRTAVGSHTVSEASSPTEIATGDWESHLLAPSAGLGDLPFVSITAEQEPAVANGMSLASHVRNRDGEPHRIVDESGRLLAVYRPSGRHLVPEVVLV
ncbi:MAG: tRNA pseudouridine(55) synthase TruB [Acidimicrobiia bacterium]